MGSAHGREAAPQPYSSPAGKAEEILKWMSCLKKRTPSPFFAPRPRFLHAQNLHVFHLMQKRTPSPFFRYSRCRRGTSGSSGGCATAEENPRRAGGGYRCH